MTILNKIITVKKQEVDLAKKQIPLGALKDQAFYYRTTLSLEKAITNNLNIISEFKRQSPSKGVINAQVDIETITKDYEMNGAAALSILTDQSFFGGSNHDIISVRNNINLPILRKEFIIDHYQIHEAKAIGADAILLIAACLTPIQVEEYTAMAKNIGLDVLLEIHQEEELKHIGSNNKLVGINNRDLKTFNVSLQKAISLRNQLPKESIAIAESGIRCVEDIKTLMENDFHSFLIGEYFMKELQPGLKLNELINLIIERHECH